MKKVLITVLMSVLILLSYITVANAATTEEIVSYASKTFTIAGQKVKLSDGDILKIKRYLSENPVSDKDGDILIEKAEQIISIMNTEGVSNPTKLSKTKKEQVLTIAQEAAAVTGATLTYDSTNKVITIYKNGKAIDTVSLQNNKLVQTGNDNTVYVVIGSVAIIAVATILISKKRKENA